MPRTQGRRNERLAKRISIAALVCLALFTVLILSIPERALLVLQRLDVKLLLIIISWIVVAIIAIYIWLALHVPSAERYVVSARRILITITVPFVAAQMTGIPSFEGVEIEISQSDSIIISASFGPGWSFSALSAVSAAFMVSLFIWAHLKLTWWLVEIQKYQKKYGALEPA